MGDFPEVPTRQELYAKVNEWFFATHPNAPEELHPTDPDHAEWRREWIRLRDDLLNAETNRIYWEAYPTGPEKIDPSNPEHDPYEKAWLEIRGWILNNTPDPFGEQEMADAEARYARELDGLGAMIREDFYAVHTQLPEDLWDTLDDAINDLERDVSNAYKSNEVPKSAGGDQWHGSWREFRSPSEPSKGVKVRPWAYIYLGQLMAGVESEILGG